METLESDLRTMEGYTYDQGRVWRDSAGEATFAVGVITGDGEEGFFA